MTTKRDILEALNWGADPEHFTPEDRAMYARLLESYDRVVANASRWQGTR